MKPPVNFNNAPPSVFSTVSHDNLYISDKTNKIEHSTAPNAPNELTTVLKNMQQQQQQMKQHQQHMQQQHQLKLSAIEKVCDLITMTPVSPNAATPIPKADVHASNLSRSEFDPKKVVFQNQIPQRHHVNNIDFTNRNQLLANAHSTNEGVAGPQTGYSNLNSSTNNNFAAPSTDFSKPTYINQPSYPDTHSFYKRKTTLYKKSDFPEVNTDNIVESLEWYEKTANRLGLTTDSELLNNCIVAFGHQVCKRFVLSRDIPQNYDNLKRFLLEKFMCQPPCHDAPIQRENFYEAFEEAQNRVLGSTQQDLIKQETILLAPPQIKPLLRGIVHKSNKDFQVEAHGIFREY